MVLELNLPAVVQRCGDPSQRREGGGRLPSHPPVWCPAVDVGMGWCHQLNCQEGVW